MKRRRQKLGLCAFIGIFFLLLSSLFAFGSPQNMTFNEEFFPKVLKTIEDGNLSKAEEMCEYGAEQVIYLAIPLYVLFGRYYRENGETDKAIFWFSRSKEIANSFVKIDSDTKEIIGNVLDKLIWEKYISDFSVGEGTQVEKDQLYKEGIRLYEQGQYRDAKDVFTKVIISSSSDEPVLSTFYYNLATCFSAEKNIEMARLCLRRALRFKPTERILGLITDFLKELGLPQVKQEIKTPIELLLFLQPQEIMSSSIIGATNDNFDKAKKMLETKKYKESKEMMDLMNNELAKAGAFLCNIFGAMLYDKGNCKEAKLYFQKTVELITNTGDETSNLFLTCAKELLDRTKTSAVISFDPSIDRLPPNYKGNNIVKAYEEIKKKWGPKDTFETTNEYRKRIQSATPNNIYAFKTEDRLIFPKYDADTQLMEINLSLNPIYTDLPYKALRALLIEKGPSSKSYYTLSNNSGGTVTVEKCTSIDYEIIIVNSSDIIKIIAYYPKDELGHIKITANVPPKEAEAMIRVSPLLFFMENPFGILFICKLKKLDDSTPLTTKGYSHSKPTFKYPVEFSIFKNYICVELLEIWVYDFRSGKIFLKQKIKNASSNH